MAGQDRSPHGKGGLVVKTIMGWIDRIVSKLARRKVNKDEGRPGSR